MLPSTTGGNSLEYAQNAVQAALEHGVKLLVLNTSGLTPEAAFTAGARAGEDAPINAYVIDMQPVLKAGVKSAAY